MPGVSNSNHPRRRLAMRARIELPDHVPRAFGLDRGEHHAMRRAAVDQHTGVASRPRFRPWTVARDHREWQDRNVPGLRPIIREYVSAAKMACAMDQHLDRVLGANAIEDAFQPGFVRPMAASADQEANHGHSSNHILSHPGTVSIPRGTHRAASPLARKSNGAHSPGRGAGAGRRGESGKRLGCFTPPRPHHPRCRPRSRQGGTGAPRVGRQSERRQWLHSALQSRPVHHLD